MIILFVIYFPISELTRDAIGAWSKLPIDIRCDSSFGLFQQEFERTKGYYKSQCELCIKCSYKL